MLQENTLLLNNCVSPGDGAIILERRSAPTAIVANRNRGGN